MRFNARYLLVFLILLLPSTLLAQTVGPAWNWGRSMTSPNDTYLDALTTDASGNTFVAGNFRDSVIIGANTLRALALNDSYVAKYSPTGSLLWLRHLKGSGNEFVAKLVTDGNGNLYIAGNFNNDIDINGTPLYATNGGGLFTMKLNPQGQIQWLRNATSSAKFLQSMGIDAAGNMYLSGSFSGRLTIGAYTITTTSGIDQFLAKLDANGVCQWIRQGGRIPLISGGPAVQYYYHSLTVGPNGDCFLSWTINNGAGAFGSLPVPPSFGDFDVAIIKYDTQGTLQWMQQFGSLLRDYAGATTLDNQGHLLATMRFATSSGGSPATIGNQTVTGSGLLFATLVQLDATTGSVNWVRTLSSSITDSFVDVATDATGNSYVAGFITGNALFGNQRLQSTSNTTSAAIVVSYSPLGAPRWAQQSGSLSKEGVSLISLDGTGHLSLGGYFTGLAQLGSTTLTGPTVNTPSSCFVARLTALPLATTAPITPAPLALTLVPNPATNQVQLPGLPSNSTVYLLDAVGRVVKQSTTLATTAQLSLQGLASGLYIVRATDVDGHQYSGRLIVQ
jgi:hypothetical protein